MKLTKALLVRMLEKFVPRGSFGEEDDLSEIFSVLESHDVFRFPIEGFGSGPILIEERFSVLGDARSRKARLVKLLEDNEGDGLIIGDSLIPGLDGVYFVALVETPDEAADWLAAMDDDAELLVKRITSGGYIVASPLKAFRVSKER